MNSSKRNILPIALILILAGGVLFLFVLSRFIGFDFTLPGNADMREYELMPEGSYAYVTAALNDCDLSLRPAADGKTSLTVRCPEDSPVTAEVEDGVLKIRSPEAKKRFLSFFSVNRESPSVTLYLPVELTPALTTVSTSGDIDSTVTNAFSRVSVQTVSGDIAWNGETETETIEFHTTSGDVTLSRPHISDILTVSTISGDIRAYDCDAENAGVTLGTTSGEILLKSSAADSLAVSSTSGDITVEESFFRLRTNLSSVSGDMMLADLVTDGPCQIDTTSGDIHLVRVGASGLSAETVSGSVTGSLLGIEEEFRGNGSASGEGWTVTTVSGFVHIFPEE